MKYFKLKKIAVLFSLLVFLLCGCGQKETTATYKKTGPVAGGDLSVSNARYTMLWNDKKKIITLTDNTNGNVWSTTPESALKNDPIASGYKNHPQAESGILVTYYDTEKYVTGTALSATSALKDGRIGAVKSNDTISVVYDFVKEEFTVTVDYTLEENGFTATVDPKKITEGEKKQVTSVAVAPFLCAVDNGSADSYVFVPSGSGALIYSDVKTQKPAMTSEPVFGEDLSIYKKFRASSSEAVRLPVYGSISGNKGMTAIIEEGAGSSNICSVSNSENVRYTSVYADFAVRGSQTVDVPDGIQLATKTAHVFSDVFSDSTLKIRFVPLFGEGISYVDMAKVYREYLTKEYALESKTAKEAVSLRIYGGVMNTEYLFGIPYSALQTFTTLEEAESIIDSMEQEYGGKLIYNLDGFGKKGLDIGEIAGGYGVGARLGNTAQLKKLFRECSNKDINLFMNFDLVRYNKSGSGFSTGSDAATAATRKRVIGTYTDIVSRDADPDAAKFYLLSREQTDAAAKKLKKFADKNELTGISLDTLSNRLYSDYRNVKYYAKANEGELTDILDSVSEDRKLLTTAANSYAAVVSDYIDSVPTASSQQDAFDVDVPFYQLVYKGLVPMFADNIDRGEDAILKAMETGIGVSMAVMQNYDSSVLSASQKNLCAAGRKNLETQMKHLEERDFFEYHASVKDSAVREHTLLTKEVRKTVFENGVTIYVNYSDREYSEGGVTVAAGSYLIEKGEVR